MAKVFTVNGEEMNYKGVQAIAKEHGIRANQSGDVLVKLIEEETAIVEAPDTDVLFDDEDDNEEEIVMEEKKIAVELGVIKWSHTCTHCKATVSEGSFVEGAGVTLCPDCVTDFGQRYVDGEVTRREKLMAHFNVTKLHVCGDNYCNSIYKNRVFSPVEGYYCPQCAWVKSGAAKLQDKKQKASEPKASEQSKQQQPNSKEDVNVKPFEFVSANKVGVRFKQKGELVRIGFSQRDAKSYIQVGDGEVKPVMVRDAIKKLQAHYQKAPQEVGRIVHALQSILKNYASIKQAVIRRNNELAKENLKKVADENVSRQQTKENRKRSNRGVVDAKWLSAFKEKFEAKHDRQPLGKEILAAKTLAEAKAKQA